MFSWLVFFFVLGEVSPVHLHMYNTCNMYKSVEVIAVFFFSLDYPYQII